jgi:chitinase
MHLTLFFTSLSLCLILVSCLSARQAPTPQPTATILPTATPVPKTFRIVGYTPDWDTVVEEVQFDKLTHINYAFLLPNSDGTFKEVANPQKLRDIVTQAHVQGVQVLISVGGWGYDEQFETLAADPSRRRAFVDGLCRYVNDYALDGGDIDWEYPDPGDSSQNFLALMQELHSALPQGKLLTSAVVASGSLAEGIPSEVFGIVNFLNIMAYDGSETDHSPYGYAEQALDYWLGLGLPPEKAVLGVPFYSRPGEMPYRMLVQADPTAAYLDEFNYAGSTEYYNGIDTIQRKTQLAMQRGSGIMIWELAQDSSDTNSLLNAIYQTAHGSPLPAYSAPTPVD